MLKIKMVAVVQLVRASDCGSECRGFESHLPPGKRGSSKRTSSFCFVYSYRMMAGIFGRALSRYYLGIKSL